MGAGHELVHARALVRKVQLALDALAQVVGGQHRVERCLGQAVAAHGDDVCVRPHQHAEVAVEAADSPDRLRPLEIELEVAVQPLYRWGGQERHELRLHAYGSGSRTASAVRRGERLVQVHVDGVEAHVAGAADAHERVEVGPVVVELRSCVVHQLRNIQYVPLKQTQGIGVRKHQRGDSA